MKLDEVTLEIIHRAVDTEYASAFEIKAEIRSILKMAGVGSTVHYKTKKGISIGTKTDKGITISKPSK